VVQGQRPRPVVRPHNSRGNPRCEAVSIWPSLQRTGTEISREFIFRAIFHRVRSNVGHTPRQHRVRRLLEGEECQGQGQVQSQGLGQQDRPAPRARGRVQVPLLSFLSGRRGSEGDESRMLRGARIFSYCLLLILCRSAFRQGREILLILCKQQQQQQEKFSSATP
jgi:hypothetical protein